MSTAVTKIVVTQAVRDLYSKAYESAVRDDLVAFRTPDPSAFKVPSARSTDVYQVTYWGSHWTQATCTCPATKYGAQVCKHRALVVWALKHDAFGYAVNEEEDG